MKLSDGSVWFRDAGVWLDTGGILKGADGPQGPAGVNAGGDVVGPVSALGDHVALFDGASGKLLKTGGALGSGAFAAAYVHPDHVGDVASSGAGATVIANGAVTLAKMADIDQNRLLGRSTAGSGSVEALTSATVRSMLGVAETSHGHDASAITSGVLDIARIPVAALERLVAVADQTARFLLTTATVQLGDVVKENDSGHLFVVVDEAHLGDGTGYVQYASGSAATVPWSGVTGKPATFPPEAHTQAASTISDFDAAVAGNSAVAANTAKVSNAIHTGDVTGGAALTIANGVVTLPKMQEIATDRILGRATAGSGSVELLPCTVAGRALLGGADASAQLTTLGVDAIGTRKSKLDATVVPTVNDDLSLGYGVGSVWIIPAANAVYVCTDATDGAAVWNHGSMIIKATTGLPTYVAGVHFGSILVNTFDNTVHVGIPGAAEGPYWQLMWSLNLNDLLMAWGVAPDVNVARQDFVHTPASPLVSVSGVLTLPMWTDGYYNGAFVTTLFEDVTAIIVAPGAIGPVLPTQLMTATLIVTQDATTPRTLSLSSGYTWAGGDAPNIGALGKRYILRLQTFDQGATWLVSCLGSAGAAGAPGAVWYHGSGMPDDGSGIQGDRYLRGDNGAVYAKGASTWSDTGISLKGPTGASGNGSGNVIAATETTAVDQIVVCNSTDGTATKTSGKLVTHVSFVNEAETRSAAIDMADNVVQRPELKDWAETAAATAGTSGTQTLDMELANVWTTGGLTGNVTIAITHPPASGKAGTATWIFTQDATSARTVTLPAGGVWATGS
ncbi:MAG: hypothetical protein HQM02_13340, partial [Magnetococcales bacterium]|nr:hypothetical protein [Magnetococcales bacterium]